MSQIQRILLTGFGAFPGVPENVSGAVVTELARAARELQGVAVRHEVLPVDWRVAPRQVAELIAAERPHVALHFGVSSRAQSIVVETLAKNHCASSADVCGALPTAEWLDKAGAASLRSTFPAGAILRRLEERGLPAELSEDAGAYLCNAVLYASLSACAGSGARSGFIHLPVDLSGSNGGLTLEAAVSGGLEILHACLETDPLAAPGCSRPDHTFS